ncbi:hypothetical protein ACJJTC_011828 [Scirpophaga incertulas]
MTQETCPHFEIGLITIKFKDLVLAETSRASTSSTDDPIIPEAQTEPNSPDFMNRLTPDNSILQEIVRPKKRNIRFYSAETDEEVPLPKKLITFWDLSSDENYFFLSLMSLYPQKHTSFL